MTTNPLSPADQIAAINRKRTDEHRRVDLQHDQLIQQVRDRCDHEYEEVDDSFSHEFGTHTVVYNRCAACGETAEYAYSPMDDDVF